MAIFLIACYVVPTLCVLFPEKKPKSSLSTLVRNGNIRLDIQKMHKNYMSKFVNDKSVNNSARNV